MKGEYKSMGDDKLLKEMGARINARRRELKMTQETLAEKMDVSVQMISNLELGKKAIRPENIIKLCENKPDYKKLYDYNDKLENKVKKICKEIYRAGEVTFSDKAKEKLASFEKNGFWRKAIQAYYDSIRVFPNFTKTYSNVGNIFYKLEKYDYAKLYWLEAFKMDKTNI